MDEKTLNSTRLLGDFKLPDGREIFGEISLDSSDTLLKLRSDQAIYAFDNSRDIHGRLHDLRRVSCLQCVRNSSRSISMRGEGSYFETDVTPHFVTIGSSHLYPEKSEIQSVHFVVDDLESIFDDFDAFGFVFEAESLIDRVVRTRKSDREIKIGASPIITYFTGKEEIIGVDTDIGRISVKHIPNHSMGDQKGINIKNHMTVSINAKISMTFKECIQRVQTVVRFLSLLAGRKQGIKSIYLYLVTELGKPKIPLELNWSFMPKSQDSRGDERYKPDARDIPLDALHRPEEFSKVLKHWISRDSTWMRARLRYDNCLGKGNFYNSDRLIAAANMFDILPDVDVPCASELSVELAEAKSKCLEIFKGLERGVERDSVIGALSRMSKPSLPKKVLYRANIVQSRLGSKIADLNLVVQTAVKCRNYYVHGGSSDFDYNAIEPLSDFLTDSLEFVFVVSDLIEAGWDVGKWSNSYLSYGHSFSRFMSDYAERSNELRVALKKT